jgi:hypothetical protein
LLGFLVVQPDRLLTINGFAGLGGAPQVGVIAESVPKRTLRAGMIPALRFRGRALSVLTRFGGRSWWATCRPWPVTGGFELFRIKRRSSGPAPLGTGGIHTVTGALIDEAPLELGERAPEDMTVRRSRRGVELLFQ